MKFKLRTALTHRIRESKSHERGCLHLYVSFVSEKYTSVGTINVFSDGAVPQFKQRYLF